MSAHVREATVADSAGIARVRIETWRAAYRGLVPQEALDIVAAYEQAIIDGTIVVPADEEELAAFTPVALDAAATPVA